MTLDVRKGRILYAIVNEYVDTAEPIGSEWLVTRYDFGCKSATLRNEMAEMAERGFLVQPHTSAGRVPSDRGYRYFVDCLMPAAPETFSNSRYNDRVTALRNPDNDVEDIIQATCRMLSEMTHYPSVATPPSADTTQLHRLYLSSASDQHVLLVLLLSTGQVEHRLLEVGKEIGKSVSETTILHTANYLNSVLSDRELTDLAQGVPLAIPAELGGERRFIETVYARVVQAANALSHDRVYLEGTSHILRQREFQDVIRLEQLLAVLEQKHLLYRVFQQGSAAPAPENMSVVIGTESSVEAMHTCSVVTSRYHIGNRVGGYIGVVGPTRMRYDHAIAAVGWMAAHLSSFLTHANLA